MLKNEIENQDLVQQIIDQIEVDGGKITTKIDLKRNYVIDGRDKKHNVDIYWKFRLGEKTHLVIVEVKDSESTVDLEQLFQLKSVMNDLREQAWGVFVTRTGYQREILEYANRNHIILYELRKPGEIECTGRIKTFNITLHIYNPHFANIKFEQDVDWNVQELARLKIPLNEASKLKVEGSDELKFYDENDKEFTNALRFFNSLVPKGFDELPPTKIIYSFDKPTFIKTLDSRVRIKIKSVEVTISKTHIIKEYQLNAENFVEFIIKSVSNETSTSFYKVV
jgi:hypothetical protein